MNDADSIVIHLEDLIDYVDTSVHQVLGPENWCVYSSLRDMIDSICADVEKLIEKSEHVEPVLDETTKRFYRCGACGEYVGFIDSDPGDPNEQDCFCRNCGRKVKWP